MTKLHRLYEGQGQSPWLDNLTRDHLRIGHLAGLVQRGTVARTIGENADVAAAILTRAADLVVDLADAGRAPFTRSFAEVLARLQAKVVANA